MNNNIKYSNMKSRLFSACALAALCFSSSIGIARNPINLQPAAAAHTSANKTEAGTCTVPSSQFDLDINNVRARVLNAGDVWWDLNKGRYEVPKGSKDATTAQFPQAIFAGAIWVSALDQGNNLRMAAQTYRQGGTTDFFAGPLDNTGNVSLSSCNAWNQHFNVFATEIKPIADAIAANPSAHISSALLTPNILAWPGRGNPNIAAKFPTDDLQGILAPFYDANGDGIYNPADGDYPTIKQGGVGNASSFGAAYADQMIFWVMNDKGNVHTGTNGTPMGVQVNALAFAFQSSDEINDMTFYTYSIINKSGTNFNKTYMSQWTDVDLGCANNDRVGCDTTRSLAVAYNGSSPDGGSVCPSAEVGYGADLPMLGIDFFEGPTDTIRVSDGHGGFAPKKLGMSSFCYFNINGGATTGDPTTAVQYRNYQTGFWKNGTPITFGGSGYQYSAQRINYTFPGDPAIATQWSECNPQLGSPIPYGDRRFVQTSGPFTFLSGAVEPITVGVVFVKPAGGVGTTCPSWNGPLGQADDKAQALFDNHFAQLVGPTPPTLSIRELSNKVIINFIDNKDGTNKGESFAKVDPLRVRKGYKSTIIDTLSKPPATPTLVTDTIHPDSLYRFQGYILYQLATEDVSVNDLSNSTKAVAIGVFDIADDVKFLTNWDLYTDANTLTSAWVPEVGTTIPGVGNKLPNTGVPHTFLDSIDHIAGGRLINYKTYYYGALAFATNNFKTFAPATGTGQNQPFLIGKSLAKYSAIPQDIETENGGRSLTVGYGTSTVVERLEGQGNGGNYLNLTPETITRIVDFLYADTLQYQQGYDPLGFKVVDPLLLKDADFELKIYDTIPYNGVSVSTKAWWELTDITNGNVIKSQRPLDRPYEQLISLYDSTTDAALASQLGFSLTLGTPFPVYTNQVNHQPIYGPIGGSISFADPSNPWLSFVKDAGTTDITNWIRAGSVTAPCAATNPDPLCNIFEDAYYKVCPACPIILTDPQALFGDIAGGTWAPYCLAANWSNKTPPGIQPAVTGRTVTTVAGPAFRWDAYNDKASPPENTLEKLQSVDVVLTSDKSKWTHCVVFETGDDGILGDIPDPTGGDVPPRKGMLRNHNGLNKDGSVDVLSDHYGMSWFPGYAINIETGQRLNVAFGEASDLGDQNGRDMIWNPTSKLFGDFNMGGVIPYKPLLGGMHFLYVLNTSYIDYGQTLESDFVSEYGAMITTGASSKYSDIIRSHYNEIMWTSIPYLTPGYSMKTLADGLIPNDVTIKLRVQKPYAKQFTNATDTPKSYSVNVYDTATHALTMPMNQDSLPRYKFSTKGMAAKQNVPSIAKSSLDLIRVVPNPYLAYSAYEKSANDSRVKVTNLPNVCNIKIYTLEGVLVRTIIRSVTKDPVDLTKTVELSEGYNFDDQTASTNLDNSVEWDLKNEKAIPVGSGIYLFDIDVPGVGHKILKWFGAMRPTDISNF